MWIRSQNGKRLMNCNVFEVLEGGGWHRILGGVAGASEHMLEIGKYKTETEAIGVLHELESIVNAGEPEVNQVYPLPEEGWLGD